MDAIGKRSSEKGMRVEKANNEQMLYTQWYYVNKLALG